MPRKSKKRHVSSEVLAKGVSVAALGLGFLLMSVMLGSNANPTLRPIGKAIGGLVPYVLLLGGVLCLVGWLLRPKQGAPERVLPRREPDLLPRDSTDFAPSPSSLMPSFARSELPPVRRPPAKAWSAQVFEDIEWRRFETLCAELFGQAGFEARTQSHGADGGVDIWLHSRHSEGPAAVVQCKHWHGKQVGVKEMREFFGVMASRKITRGTYATTSTFTEDAVRFARENSIHLLDGAGLLGLIRKRTPDQQQALLEHAYEGEYWRPTCASCGIKMVERTARKDSSSFWGCANFPRCRSTLLMRAG